MIKYVCDYCGDLTGNSFTVTIIKWKFSLCYNLLLPRTNELDLSKGHICDNCMEKIADTFLPTEKRDCNDCINLNLTEVEQRMSKKLFKKPEPHKCLLYNQQVFHHANTQPHLSYLHPVDKCIGFKPRNPS